MIAYELAIETGIAVSATVTAGTTTTLSAARLALLAQKLKRLERYADRIDDLLKIKCFSRDTLVHTATGPRPIGEIEPGEQIWSYHFERGVWGLCEVKERLDNTYSGPVISITVDSTTIEATAYHPFWVIEGRDLQERSKPRELQEREDEGHSLPGRWVNSHELRAGDCIITRSGTRALITEIRQRFDDAFPVSNLSIIGHHNYAVGDVGVLVHNKPVCDETIADLRKLHGDGKSDDEIRNWLRSQTDNDGNRLYDDSEIDDAMSKILAKKGAAGLNGEDFEKYIRRQLGSIGNLKASNGREIDGLQPDGRRYEAKSAFNYLFKNGALDPKKWNEFTSQILAAAAEAAKQGKKFVLLTNVTPPPEVIAWLAKRGILWELVK